MITFEYNHPLAGEKAVLALETELGVRLPPDYKRFLETQNGGRPDDYEVEVPGWGSTIVNHFLGVGAPGRNDLAFQICRMSHLLPPSVIPIADDPGGNYFCISLSAPDAGCILLWDHEFSTPDKDEGETEFKMYAISGSFSDFENSLRRLAP